MNKFISILFALSLFGAHLSHAKGKIQNEDVKSLSELTTAGGAASQLINDTKIYLSGSSKQLSQAISDGDFATSSTITENAQTGTSYTLVLGDKGKLVSLSNAAAVTATVPPNSSVAFPVGTTLKIASAGAGPVQITPGAGVTINSLGGFTRLAGQYAFVDLIKSATNIWYMTGQLIDAAFIAATGGTETTDGDYKVRTFTSSGTFQILAGTGTVEYLAIAGGGGGGGAYGGGGGAGGLQAGSFSRTVGSYTVTVGAGGAGGAANNVGVVGSNSVFDTVTANGGGYGGGGGAPTAGGNGGSGGGGGQGTSPAVGGTGSQGGNGGTSNPLAAGQVGGGGGGGAAPGNGTDAPIGGTAAGNGGAGFASSITGTSVTYASGGGGGAGVGDTGGTVSAGGGGAGGSQGVTGTAGTANTGGGGGGGGGSASGGAGGSGIVIVRYKFQ